MKYITYAVAIALIITAMVFMVSKAIVRSERVECAKLEMQSKQYTGFFYSEWQKEMCDIN